MKPIKRSIAFFSIAWLLACAPALAPAGAATVVKSGPPLEVVHTFGNDFPFVGIGVSHDGRVFATAPSGSLQGGLGMVEVHPGSGRLTPYPDAAWNHFNPKASGKSQWIVPQALWVDSDNHLWALDSSRGDLDQTRLAPKLVEFDLATNKPIREYFFEGTVTPKDSINDVRVDAARGYAYLTNADNQGGIVVLNLRTGRSRMLLAGTPSVLSAPGQHLTVNGKIARLEDGSPLIVPSDGIAISPDMNWLYYRPITDHNYWRVPTAALRDVSLTPQQVASKVQFLGESVVSGGLVMDSHGVLYGGDLEHHGIAAMTIGPDQRIQTRILLRDPKLSWADGFAISGDWLYIADSHLWELILSDGPPRSGPLTMFRVRLPDGK